MPHRRSPSPEDAEVDDLSSHVKNKAQITPAESTPQELVKIDPAEVGMSLGYKHLYVTSSTVLRC